MRTPVAILILLFGALAVADAHADTAKVTYVTSQTFYIDAGQRTGVATGAMVEIVRGEEVVGHARVKEVSAGRAVCELLDGEITPAVGDEIRYTAVTTPVATASGGGQGTWFDRVGLHGRIGLQSTHLRDQSGYGSNFDNPALNLRLYGRDIAGSSVGAEVDVRARMVHRTTDGNSETESRSRIYRLNAFGGTPGRGIGWTAGRQYAPSLSVLHLFDGLRVQYERKNWSTGILGGAQPDPRNLGLSGDVLEGGAWYTLRQTSERTRWALTTAVVAAYAEGSVDREFAWVQGRWARGDVSLRADQVIDLNRSWKKDAGEPLISSTSTYLMARWQAHQKLRLTTGLDTRRRVRMFRDRETPETEFDDSYRRGFWLGAQSRILRWLDLGIRARTRGRANSESANSGTFNVGVRTPWLGALRFDSRSSMYESQLVQGWLQSLRMSANPHSRVSTGVFGGIRSEQGRSNDLMDGEDYWVGADIDLTLPQRAWLSLSWESYLNGEEDFNQFWIGTGMRF